MSLAQIRPVVERFISDDRNGLLVIKGGWGVGKTYFWQDVIRGARADGSVGRAHYSYVSLFGVNSLEELKNSILAARVGAKSAGVEDGVRALLAGAKQLLKGAENAPFLREWTGGMASTALFLLLAKDTLVCFDDIERKGDGLASKDVLGLASLLKEQRDCKVVLILNDGSLHGEEQDNFRRHGEKIIDVEVEFSPLPQEAFGYAFEKNHPHYESVRAACLDLRIKNIRILQRVRRFAGILLEQLEGSEPTVAQEALRSLVLYVWCYYDKEGGAPPPAYVRNFDYVERFIRERYKGGVEESAEERRWADSLTSYGHSNNDELDRHIASLVEKGYLDEAGFRCELEKKNAFAHAQQAEHSYSKAWELFNNSFADNEQEFVEELAASFRANVMHLSVVNLHNTARVLRDLGRGELADALIDEYFDRHAEDSALVKMRRSAFLDELKDPYLNERLRAAWRAPEDRRTLAEVVKDLTKRSGWGPEDVELLAACDVDEYYRFFKSEDSDDLYHYVRTCLRFGEGGNTNELLKAIAGKAEAALKRIAAESRINRIRVAGMFKIEVDGAES